MITIEITKTINLRLLSELLEVAFGQCEFWAYPHDDAWTLAAPDGIDPAAVQAVIDAHDPTADDEEAALRKKVISIAQSAVGVKLTDLTAAFPADGVALTQADLSAVTAMAVQFLNFVQGKAVTAGAYGQTINRFRNDL